MTRKTALLRAIQILTPIESEESTVSKLQEMLDEYPSPHWSKLKIIDAFRQWVADHGQVPSSTTIDADRSLPSHSTIKQAFGMTASEFMALQFPSDERPIRISNYGSKTAKEWGDALRQDFIRVGAIGATDYNKKRSMDMPVYQVIMRILDVATWGELAAEIDLPDQIKPTRNERNVNGKCFNVKWDSPSKREFERIKEERRQLRNIV